MRIKRPFYARPEDVKINRRGERAVIIYHDPLISPTELWIGPEIHNMSDQDILKQHNTVLIMKGLAEEEWIIVEVPPGVPQIEFHERHRQWVPRGEVLRCIVSDSGTKGQPTIHIDDHALSLSEFGKMLTGFAGWGMRITFVPEESIWEPPRTVMCDPHDRGKPNAGLGKVVRFPTASDPCIDDVFVDFLRDISEHFKSSTTRGNYRQVIDLYRDHLNFCGPIQINRHERALLNRLTGTHEYDGFCRVFGPEKILPELYSFLDECLLDLLPASRTARNYVPRVMKRLFDWLASRELVDEVTRRAAIELADDAGDKLRRACRAVDLLYEHRIAKNDVDLELGTSYYRIMAVEKHKLWVVDPLAPDAALIPIDIPHDISSLLEEEWLIECRLAQVGGQWKVSSVVEIYPQ